MAIYENLLLNPNLDLDFDSQLQGDKKFALNAWHDLITLSIFVISCHSYEAVDDEAVYCGLMGAAVDWSALAGD